MFFLSEAVHVVWLELIVAKAPNYPSTTLNYFELLWTTLFQLLCSLGPIRLQFWFPCLLCFLWFFFLFEGTEKIQGKIGWIFLWILQYQIPWVLFCVFMGANPYTRNHRDPRSCALSLYGQVPLHTCYVVSGVIPRLYDEKSEEWAWEELEWHRCDPGVYTRTTNYKLILHWGLTLSNFWLFF